MQDAPSHYRSINWVEDLRKHISKSLMTATAQILVQTKLKNADCFDKNFGCIRRLLEDKYKANAAYKNNPSSTRLKDMWKDAHSTCQRELRALENQWWIKKSEEIQRYADSAKYEQPFEPGRT